MNETRFEAYIERYKRAEITPVFIVRGKGRWRRQKPGYIKGTFADRRLRGMKKTLVFHLASDGTELVSLIPLKFVHPQTLELEP